jgi:hypothetical protein
LSRNETKRNETIRSAVAVAAVAAVAAAAAAAAAAAREKFSTGLGLEDYCLLVCLLATKINLRRHNFDDWRRYNIHNIHNIHNNTQIYRFAIDRSSRKSSADTISRRISHSLTPSLPHSRFSHFCMALSNQNQTKNKIFEQKNNEIYIIIQFS